MISEDYSRNGAVVVDNKAEPENTFMGTHTVNPQAKVACSTAVTPIQTFLPTLKDVSWAISLVSVLIDMLDEGPKRRQRTVMSSSRELIDNNDFLPTSTGAYTLRIAQ